MRLDQENQSDSFEYLHKFYSDLENQERDFRNNNPTELILNYLKEGSKLDVGCGVGFLLLKAKNRSSRLTGLEPNEKLTNILGLASDKSIEVFNIQAQELFKIKGRFDNITMIDVLEHIEDDDT